MSVSGPLTFGGEPGYFFLFLGVRGFGSFFLVVGLDEGERS